MVLAKLNLAIQPTDPSSFVQRTSFGITNSFCLICLIMFASGCSRSESISDQEPEKTLKSSPKIVQEDPEDTQIFGRLENSSEKTQKLANVPALTIRPATQTELGPEIQTASLELTRRMPVEEVPATSGTAKWDLEQISALMTESEELVSDDSEVSESTRLARIRENNQRIVSLASHAISITHDQPDQVPQFNAAVHSLMEARFQLSLQGDEAALQELYNDAAVLAKQQPNSVAAVIASGTIVRLAEKLALRDEVDSPWLSEHVRQAKLFATNFRKEEARAIVQLISAAELCEERNIILPAIECYTVILQTFPESPFKERIEASLRRVSLIDRKLTLEGPTFEGQLIALKDFAGQNVIIAFWSSKSHEFANQLEELNQLSKSEGYAVIGINLDSEPQDYQEFLLSHDVPGKHIFYPVADLRGANQPFAKQYGVSKAPSYWLIDAEGLVQATALSLKQLSKLTSEKSITVEN
ncbi:TlpA disulfide reductase family protein [uncultured Rubinisphaera sp.]|mgnify:FL=1|uniref:peroxiredoxin family protein n=1 Tax=uncultured Rubinisphaera sp. TaxID=1678686 RepID=UPI0030DABAF0